MDEMYSQMDEMYSQMDEMYSQMDEMYSQMAAMYLQMDQMYSQLDEKYSQMEQMYSQMDEMYSQMDFIENPWFSMKSVVFAILVHTRVKASVDRPPNGQIGRILCFRCFQTLPKRTFPRSI